MYYLLYNINNKIFAFRLLSMEVLYCNSTQVQGYSIYRLGIPEIGTSKQAQRTGLLNSSIGVGAKRLCGHADGDGVCVCVCVLLLSGEIIH